MSSNIPKWRFYLVAVIMYGVGYLSGFHSGGKGEQVDMMAAIIAQQKSDQEVIGEEYSIFNSMSASEYIVQ